MNTEEKAKEFYAEMMKDCTGGYRPTDGTEPQISWLIATFADGAIEEFIKRVLADYEEYDSISNVLHAVQQEMKSGKSEGDCTHPLEHRRGISPVDRSEVCELCGWTTSDPMKSDVKSDAGSETDV